MARTPLATPAGTMLTGEESLVSWVSLRGMLSLIAMELQNSWMPE